MVIREVGDGSTHVSTREKHAALSAQFAAHWGNDRFARLQPYDTLVFATTDHDSRYREWERLPPMDVEASALGAPGENPGVRDHGTHGLLAKRQVGSRARPLHRPARFHAPHRLVAWPLRHPDQSEAANPGTQQQRPTGGRRTRGPAATGQGHLDHRKLGLRRRVVGQLPHAPTLGPVSFYFCCDGDDGFKEECLAPVPDGSVKMTSHPFDIAPLQVSVRARRIQSGHYASEAECRAAYYRMPATLLLFKLIA